MCMRECLIIDYIISWLPCSPLVETLSRVLQGGGQVSHICQGNGAGETCSLFLVCIRKLIRERSFASECTCLSGVMNTGSQDEELEPLVRMGNGETDVRTPLIFVIEDDSARGY